MMWWDGSSGPWHGMIFGPVMMIAFVVLTVVIVVWMLRGQTGSQEKTALNILQERLARGEISREEYEERKQLLARS